MKKYLLLVSLLSATNLYAMDENSDIGAPKEQSRLQQQPQRITKSEIIDMVKAAKEEFRYNAAHILDNDNDLQIFEITGIFYDKIAKIQKLIIENGYDKE